MRHTIISKPEESFALWMKTIGVKTPMREYVFYPPRRWRFDFAWPEEKFAVEIEGLLWFGKNGQLAAGRHQRRIGFEKDAEKYETAILDGWMVYRVPHTWVQIGNRMIWRKQTEETILAILSHRHIGEDNG